ncbi:MAG: amidohydrolase family protein [Pyrinomonadaceae bacterium]
MRLQVCKTFAFFFTLFFLLSLGVQAQEKKSTVGIRNVTLINMVSGTPETDMTVLISGNRLTRIGKSEKVRIPKGAHVIDGSGKFLIPGLWDMHVHIFNNVSNVGTHNKETHFPLFIANGVTGMRDMFSDGDDIKLARQWQTEIDAGTTIGPRIAVGSRIVDGPPSFLPNLMVVKTADEGRAAVRTLKKEGAGFIKVYWNLTPDAYYAIADESKKLGIVFAGHVPFSISAADVSDAGQKSIEHLTGIVETCSSKEDELRKKEWTPEVGEETYATYDAKKCLNLFKRFAKNGTWHTPTAILHRGMSLYDDDRFRNDVNFKYVSKATLNDWANSPQLDKSHEFKVRKERFERLIETIGIMHRAGVPILAGTDNNNPYVIPGFALHDELELFVKAGMSPLQALRTATTNPAKYLGLETSVGTIENGKLADMVILDANPLNEISNTRRINAVIINGRYLPKETLEKMLLGVEAAVKK